MNITGKVNKIVSNETSYGTMYNIEVDGKTYGCGKYPLKGVKEGDYIQFDAVQKGRYAQVEYKTVRVLAEPPAQASGPSPSTQASGVKAKGSYFSEEERQKIISRQAARNAALTFVQLAQSEGALEIPKTAKAGAKFDLLLGIVDEITDRFNAYAMTGKNKEVGAEEGSEEPVEGGDSWEDS